ncbi:lamin tail domain-containing protein [Microbacterium sp. NM3R9]|uniref:lamin tail domain-containing protein n=1 Tax=Microbacterium thalli TaxID=3027921 RepID=UPI00236546C6|nr:lamin tail domain-containing protein [Microbacterium thalli]MDN8549082.1 lamin tail domain-containing protein [Microbacterium thalli]
MPAERPRARFLTVALTATLATGVGAAFAAPAFAAPGDAAPAAAAPALGSLVVTEIAPDNVGADDYEYFEVHNPTGRDIDLAADGFSFAYTYVDGADRGRDVALSIAEPVVIPAGGTVILWLSYATGSVDSFARSVDDFRAHTGATPDTTVVRVTGQPGMANSAPRGIRVLQNDAIVGWSTYGRTAAAAGQSAHFRLPAERTDGGMDILVEPAPASPGVVAPEAVTPPAGEPGEPEFDPQPDPSVVTAPLQITEVLPDSANVSGSDGFEFIEVYNASSDPVSFSDYTIDYLYPVEGTSSTWPAAPSGVVIPGGETLVFWIKNGANDALTAADFNAHFASNLVLGDDLVEISSAGMANGSPRGIAVETNTGRHVSTAMYNLDGADDTVADQGIRYTVGDDLATQRIVDLAPATPGAVQADQVPAGLMIVAPDTQAPTIVDRTAGEIQPGTDFTITATVTDDVLARTVSLTLANDVDTVSSPVRANLLDAGDGTVSFVVNAADLIGKTWYEYTLTASDGTNRASTETRRVPVAGANTDPVRLNLEDGQFVAGTTEVVAAGDAYPSPIDLSIDGAAIDTEPALEAEPRFVFETTNVNYYFKNGVRIGDDVLNIFEIGTEGWETIITPVPLDYVVQGDELVVSVWAGTKKAPEIDLAENNDDFEIRGLRLVLPDGRTLTPTGYDDPAAVLRMGDSVTATGAPSGKLDFYEARFALPDDAFAAVAAQWDTTEHADGPAVVTATDGAAAVSRTVVVDNTAPVVASQIVDGTAYQGPIVIDAEVADAGSGVAEVVARLDGAEIALPYETSSVDLAAGDHEVEITATDHAGNADTWTAAFTTYDEQPSAGALAPAEGAEVPAGDVTLQAKVEDPTGDVLDVAFLEGRRLDLSDGDISVQSGTVQDARAVDRAPAEPLTTDQLRTLAAVDGVAEQISSDRAFPYQLFDVAVTDADAGADVRSTWSGRANTGATVVLYAQRADESGWDEVDRHVAASDDEAFSLDAVVAVDDYAFAAAEGRVVRMLVQHSEGFAGADLSDRTTPVAPHNVADVPRSDYDFTFAWESDTQYYNENTMPGEPYRHQQAIHSYLLDRRDELNLQYLFHTGDIVDDFDVSEQWDRADPEYRRLDVAGLPYGVLAGNHDVGHHLEDYTNYGAYFGEQRYAGNPWYGGSFENNRGHYDLVSAGGIDFVMLYTGWLPGDASIAWMNEVLAQYPDRVAIIAQHEFILTTGGLGAIPQRVMDEVVAVNPNVRMVLSGHYHDAFLREDGFDDDGDGVNDRTVFSMLFDYQGLPEGGLGFLRLLHFDNEGRQMLVRTYSPSLDVYNSDEASLLGPGGAGDYSPQQFALTYDQLRIDPGTRSLGTDAFSAEILGDTEIASFSDVASGSILSASWPLAETGERGWYVRTSDPYGAVDFSRVSLFAVIPAAEPEIPGGSDGGAGTPAPQPGGGAAPGDGGAGRPDAGAVGVPAGAARPDGLAATGGSSSLVGFGALAAAALILAGGALTVVRGRRRRESAAG